MTALACACLSQLFGGGWREFVAVFGAAAVALAARQFLARIGAGLLLQVLPAAFAGTLALALLGRLVGVQRFDLAVPSTVLHFLDGNYVGGLASGVQALVRAGAIAGGIGTVTAVVRLRHNPPHRQGRTDVDHTATT